MLINCNCYVYFNHIAVSCLKMLSLRRLLLSSWKRYGLTVTVAVGQRVYYIWIGGESPSTGRVYGTTSGSRPPAKAVVFDLGGVIHDPLAPSSCSGRS